MLDMLEESLRVSPTHGKITFHPPQQRNTAEASAPKSVVAPNVEIVLLKPPFRRSQLPAQRAKNAQTGQKSHLKMA